MAMLTGISTSKIVKGIVTVNLPDVEYNTYKVSYSPNDNSLQTAEALFYNSDSRREWALTVYNNESTYRAIVDAIKPMNGTMVSFTPHIDIATEVYTCWLTCYEDVVNRFPIMSLNITLTDSNKYVNV